jgi:hypothetical protein
VSIPREVIAWSCLARVVSASLKMNGSRGSGGRAKSSLSNYRLKLPARGTSGADERPRTRAAA